LFWSVNRTDGTAITDAASLSLTNFVPVALPTNASPANSRFWKPIDPRVMIDFDNVNPSTSRTFGLGSITTATTPVYRVWRIQFDEKGLPVEPLEPSLTLPKRITLAVRNRRNPNSAPIATGARACVTMTTLLGGLQSGNNQDCTGI
jgi:hypothetical protein